MHQVKVKESHDRPGQALRVPAGSGSQISRQSTHEGGKVASPEHRPPLHPGNIPGTHSCYRLSQTQGHSVAGRIVSMIRSSDAKTVQVGNETKGMLLYVFQQKLNYTNLFRRFTKKSNSFHTGVVQCNTHSKRHPTSKGGCMFCHL